MRLPEGELVQKRVVEEPGDALATALDRELTGYAVLKPQESLLLDGDRRAVLTFESGVPVLAYDGHSERGGPDALADLAVPGPYRVELYAVGDGAFTEAHDTAELQVPPGMPAEQLAADAGLAQRTRSAAPDRRTDADESRGDQSAVEAFLADEEKIAAIREQARAEAEQRAEEWGLEAQLDG